MATDDRKAQIGVGVDTTDAKKGFEEVKQGARDMARDVAQSGQAAARGMDGIGASGERAAAQADRATRSLASSIQRATAAAQAGSQSTAEYYRALANQRGANTSALEPYLRQLEEATRKQQQMAASAGVSAAQTAAAMRSIPAQMTDIVTQLAGGGNPLLILTQQGGQLKDMFGGIGAAARAMGSYVAGLVNPFTLLGGAAAVLALAYKQGAAESDAYARALILTGNAAGVTATQLQANAKAISASVGTQGAAAEALTALTNTGAVAAKNMESAGLAAVKMQRELGQSVAETAKQFAELGKTPLEATLKLNEQYRFLTINTYEQIKALQEQGRTADAAALAQETFAQAMNGRMNQLTAQLGYVERAARGVTGAAKSMWDALLDVGRQQTTGQAAEAVAKRIAYVQSQITAANASVNENPNNTRTQRQQAELKVLQDQLTALGRRALLEDNVATTAAAAAAKVEARVNWDKEGAQYADKSVQLQREINKARNEGIAAGKTEKEIQERIAAIKEKFTDKGAASAARSAAKDQRDAELEGIKGLERQRIEAAKQAQDEIRVLRATGVLDERQAIQENTRLDVAGLTAKKASLEDQLALMSKRKFSETEVARVAREAAQVDAEIKTRMLKGENDLIIAINAREEAWARATQAENASFVERQQDRASQIQAEVKAQLEANAAIGKSAVEIAGLEVAKLSETAATKERLAAEAEANLQSKELIDAYRAQAQALRDLAAAKTQGAVLQANADTAKKAQEEWQRTSDQIGQALTNSLMQGGKSAGDYLKGLFRTMVLQPVIQAVVQPVAGAVASLFNPGANGGSSGSSLLNTASSAFNLYKAASGAGLVSTLGGWATSLGSTLGWGGLSAFGTGMQGATLAAGLAGPTTLGASGAMGLGASFGGALSTALPWIGGALAIASLLGAFGGGTPHRGGAFTVSTDALFSGRLANAANTPGFGLESGAFRSDRSADVDKSVQSLVTGVASTIGSALTAFGLGPATVTGKFASDNDDDSWGGLRIVGRNGRLLASLDSRSLNSNPQKGFEELTQQAGKVVRDALIAADLPGWAKDILRSVSDSASVDVIGQVVTEIKAITDASKTLGPALNLSTNQFIELAKALGGASNTAALAQSYIEAIYTDAEKLKVSQKTLATTFAQLGVAVPANAAAYRRLVESQNLSTEAGRKMYVSLLQLAPVFGEITKAVQQASEGVQAEIERLRGASGTKDLATLQAQFSIKTAQARAGDSSALQALPEISKALEQARTATATSAADVAFVRASLAASLSETLRALKVPGFADGGWHDGGWRVVGERGPELEYTPPARIYSNPQSQQLLNTARLEQQLAAVTEKLIDCEEKLMAIALHSADTSKQLRRAMPEGDALAVRNAPDTTLAVTTST